MNWKYRFDFVAFPLLAIIVTAFTCRSLGWLAWAALGVLLFTFTEYWVHRSLHSQLLWRFHAGHHEDPLRQVDFPIWFTPALFTGFFLIMPIPIFAGFVGGYCWLLYEHYAIHHLDVGRWHARHHTSPRNDGDFGITHPGWDMIFGTYLPPIVEH